MDNMMNISNVNSGKTHMMTAFCEDNSIKDIFNRFKLRTDNFVSIYDLKYELKRYFETKYKLNNMKSKELVDDIFTVTKIYY